MAIEIDIDGKSIIELRNQLKGLKNDLSAATDPAEMARLAEAAGQVRDKLNDVNEQVAVFSGGSQFERVSTQLGQIKSDLGNLDFQGAADKAKVLTTMVQGISFKDAVAGVKNLGTAFMNLGKSLLTNPLFLLAAAIVTLVVVIYKLLDATGVLKAAMKALEPIFKAIGDVVDTIVQGLKNLTDWFGISANAAEDAAQRKADAAEKVALAMSGYNKSITQDLDAEIALRKLNGEQTYDLELKKVQTLRNTAYLERESALQAVRNARIKGEATDEEIAKLDEAFAEKGRLYEKSKDDVVFVVQNEIKRVKDLRDEADKKEKEAKSQAAKEAAIKARQAAKEAADTAISVNRQLIDIELSLLQEGKNKELAILNENYNRQLEDIKRNSKYNASQKLSLTTALEEKQRVEVQSINDRWNKIFEDREKETAKRVQDYRKSVYEKDKKNRLDDINDSENNLKTQSDNKIKQLEYESNADKDNLDKKIALLEAQKQAEIDNSMVIGIDKLLIEQKYANEVDNLKNETAEKDKQRERDLVSAKLQIASDGFNLLSNLTELFGNDSEESAKKAFNVNKAVSIAQATIQTYQAAQGAYLSQMSVPTPDAPVRASIAAGIAVAAGIANVAKIAKTQYKSSTPPTNNNPGGNVPSPSTPSYNLFGGGNNQNTVNASNNQPINIQNEVKVKAYVSETDITNAQDRVARYRNSATL